MQPEKFILSLGFKEIKNWLANAKKSVLICFPAVPNELVETILQLHTQEEKALQVIVSFNEQAFRNGYGMVKDYEALKSKGVNIKTVEGSKITFIIVDNAGYFLFTESLYLSEGLAGFNAVQMDTATLNRLICHFIAPSEREPHELNTEEIREGQEQFLKSTFKDIVIPPTLLVTSVNEEEEEIIKKSLHDNPPLQPDYKRILDVYTTKFQYVEMSVKNSKPGSHRANIPQDAIPVSDPELRNRLNASLKAYDLTNDIVIMELENLNKKTEDLRKEFLYRISCRKGKSIIDKSEKDAFIKEIEAQNVKYKSLKQRIIDTLSVQKTKTIEKLTAEWPRIIRMDRSMNEGFNKMSDADKTHEVNVRVTNMLTRIVFPDNEKEMDHFGIETFWSELTWEDLKDEKFQKEMKEKKLIDEREENQLASFSKSIEVKKTKASD